MECFRYGSGGGLLAHQPLLQLPLGYADRPCRRVGGDSVHETLKYLFHPVDVLHGHNHLASPVVLGPW